ncbi:MAG TPA: SDR family oxidoreductase [Microbacteriaceae bacterium]|jgi:short-subunit dehydrogenase|nr:SDR family oxidoreductase [Microbacteriaceae bacterium]
MYSYHNITALVTGASKGLGAAYATELARRGANLILVARSAAELDRRAASLTAAHGVAVHTFAADLTSADSTARLLAALDEAGLAVDLLINNAGTGAVGPFLDRPLQPNLQSVRLNIDALMTLTQAIGRGMVSRGAGGIVNIASTAAFQPMPYQSSYAATKAFVLSFTEALAEELHGSGVRVMVAHPGATATGFFDGTSAVMEPKAADSPESVATRTLDDFARGKTASYPGRWSTRVTTWAARVLPRTTIARLTGRLNRVNGFHDVVDDIA